MQQIERAKEGLIFNVAITLLSYVSHKVGGKKDIASLFEQKLCFLRSKGPKKGK